jgi:CheY-like chemotaxis protein
MSNPPPSSPGESFGAQQRKALNPPPADSRGNDARRALRILVVDDLVDAAESLAIYLRMLGHTVRTAYDGLAALAAASQFGPHVILLDIGLPKLDGYRVAEQLRQHAELQSACLIAISGFGQAADVESARAAGFDHHFIKPVEPAVLLPILQRIAANLNIAPWQ